MKSISCFQFILIVTLSASAFAKSHTLKKGDTLANIARKYYGEPVWGPKGTINKIYKLNPWTITSPNLVEPGQEILLEGDKSTDEQTSHIVTTPPTVTEQKQLPTIVKEDVVLPAIEPMKKIEPVEAKPEVTATPPAVAVDTASTNKELVTKDESVTSSPTTGAAPPQQKTKPKSFFIVGPTISIGKISTSTDPSATNYDLSSDSSYGLHLGWDHWWTSSFSTVLNYDLGQFKSTATNDTTTDSYAKNVTTHSYEGALLNKMGRFGRFGLGATYGNHLFIEGFSSSPADQSVYGIYFWNPFLMGDFNLLNTNLLDLNFTLKLALLPADVGHDHDLKTGLEYSAKITIIEKLGDSAFSFGINYLQNTQARVGTTATRTQTTLDLGYMF